MIIIGEKINGTIPSVKKAIEERDAALIRNLAIRQTEADADYLDVCAGTSPQQELDTLRWLIDIIQDAVDTPLAIDSPNPRVIEHVFKLAKRPGIINSVSAEKEKCEIIYPLVTGSKWQVIALTCNEKGIPKDMNTRVEITKVLVERAQSYDIEPHRIHIDPLVMALSADTQSLMNFVQTLEAVKRIYPSIKVTSGLSNISFGMPLRKIVNRHFLTIAMFAGMDSAIMDPCDRDMMTTLKASEALMGWDRCCRSFNIAYRQNEIGPNRVEQAN